MDIKGLSKIFWLQAIESFDEILPVLTELCPVYDWPWMVRTTVVHLVRIGLTGTTLSPSKAPGNLLALNFGSFVCPSNVTFVMEAIVHLAIYLTISNIASKYL